MCQGLKMKLLLTTLSVFLLISCESDTSSTASKLVGTWITESCEQVVLTNGTMKSEWGKSLYEFTDTNEILFGHILYSDSDCLIINKITSPAKVIDFTVKYTDLGAVQLAEGIEGNQLNISVTPALKSLNIDAYYVYSNNVCFSDVFTFGVFNFGISESGLSAINFNQCLTKY